MIYELHIGSFVSDSLGRRQGGTFVSVIGKLDYIRDLVFHAVRALTDSPWSPAATASRPLGRSGSAPIPR